MTSAIAQRLLAASIEVVVAALIVAAAGAILGRRAPRAVALLWLVVLAKPLLTLAGGALVHVPLPFPPAPARQELRSEVTRRNNVVEQREVQLTRNPAVAVVALWMAGVLVVLGRALWNRRRLRVIVAATRAPSPRLAGAYARLGEARMPPLRVSDAIDGPAIAGTFAPVILIPAWMNDGGADDAQIEWTLRHELRHAAARDTAAIAVRELALIVFWFHPAVWIAARRWEAAAELACDRDVVRSDAEAVEYADALYRTLLNVRQQRRLQLATGLFATRSKIGARIAALVQRPLAPSTGRAGAVAAAVIAVGLMSVGARATRHNGRDVTIRYDDDVAVMRESDHGVTRELRIEHGVRTYRVDGRVVPPDPSFERRMRAIR